MAHVDVDVDVYLDVYLHVYLHVHLCICVCTYMYTCHLLVLVLALVMTHFSICSHLWHKLLSKLWAMALFWDVYKAELPGKCYFGSTCLDLEDRCANMKDQPVSWLRGHKALAQLKLEGQLGRRVSQPKALALEAAYTALAWADKPNEVRGGP